MCEKPLARDLGAARRMIAAAENAGVGLHTRLVVRHFPEFARLRREVLAGRVGSPAVVRMSRAAPYPTARANGTAPRPAGASS
jgi:myo-inositol 2-dehydrogenase/D-chiro-inositol 1-dehydrogenase